MEIIELIKKEGFRRRLSPRTIKTYCFYAKQFLFYCGKEPRRITRSDIRRYMYDLADHHTGNTLNVALCAIKFMVNQILFKNWRLNIKYSKRPKNLPVVLSKEEVRLLIDAIGNPKHKLMIKLMYGAGLRVSELVNLRVSDFEPNFEIGWVRHGKGNKDRYFIIPEILKDELKDWIKDKESHIFLGYKSMHLSTRTIYAIVRKAIIKTKIKKNVHPHTLRHSFATHLIEDQQNLQTVQQLLGHKDSNTTLQYVHTATTNVISVRSPLDNI